MGSSIISMSSAMCRICRDGKKQSITYDTSNDCETLISPCLCKGTIGLCHRSCLERWLALSNRNTCEICHFTYQTARRHRTFCEFIGSKESFLERRNLITDLICFVFFTPIVFGCITFCVLLTTEQKGFTLWNDIGALQTTSLLVLSVSLSIAYFAWLIIIIIFHIKTYLNWRTSNEEILIMDQESNSNSQFSINGIERGGRQRFRSYAMHLCFDLRSLLWYLCRKDLNSPSTNSDKSSCTERERRTSILSSFTLNTNYNDFAHHLQPENGAIGSRQQTLASTPVVNQEVPVPLQVFKYPSVNSHLAKPNTAA